MIVMIEFLLDLLTTMKQTIQQFLFIKEIFDRHDSTVMKTFET